MTQRIAVFPADRHSLYEEHGYSAAIRSGDLLFISGQVGSHTDGTPEPDFQKQVRLAFENLKATLTAAGCTFDDIVDVTTFHTDPEQQLNDVMAVKQEIFAHPPYPNWTAVGVTWLAGFDFRSAISVRLGEPIFFGAKANYPHLRPSLYWISHCGYRHDHTCACFCYRLY